jgi:YbgC/YbaW family acyl-CoA thioester hydrolase
MVYHANYLKFLERGRTELIDSQDKPIADWNREGYNFAVYQMSIKFRAPARLGDVCEVITTVIGGSEYRKKLKQTLELNGEVITESEVDLVCLDADLKLREFPPGMFT